MNPQQNILQHKINTKKQKPSLVASYYLWPGNGTVLYSERSISQEVNE